MNPATAPIPLRPLLPDFKQEIEWTGHERGSGAYRRILASLAFAGLATFAGLYAPQSILPLIQRSFALTAAETALTISVSAIALAVALLPWSWAADRIGRLRAMKIALGASAVIGLMIPFAPTFEVLLVLRLLLGAALGGLPALAVTYLHDEIDRRFSAGAAAAYISGTTVGGALGRLVSGPAAALWGWRIGLLVVAGLCALSAVAFLLLVPTARGYATRAKTTFRDVAHGVRISLRRRTLVALYLQGFLLMGSFVAVYNFFAFRLEAPEFGVPAAVASLIFAAYFGGTVSSRLAGSLAMQFGQRPVVLVSGAMMLTGLALTAIKSVPVMVVGLVVFTFGFFAAHSTNSMWVGRTATTARAQATSLYNIAIYAGSASLGWATGLIWAAFSWNGVCLFISGLIALAMLVLVFIGRRDSTD